MFDITVEAQDQKDLERISADIRAALKPIKGVTDTEEVDSDVSEDEATEEAAD